MGLIFPKDHGIPTRSNACQGCGCHAESCICPKYLTPYTIALLERFASGCSSDRVRIDLLTAHRSLVERNAALSNLPSPDQLG